MATTQDRLAHAFVELADTLVEDFDVVDLLARLGERCAELFDAAAAGLLIADGQGALRLMAATSEAMEMVELFQIQNAEGPCLDCYRSGEPVEVEDLAGPGGRWPLFAPVAGDAGFRSAHAFPLRLRGRVLGALNLFRTVPGRFEPSDVAVAQALADVATIAIIQHRAAHDAQALAEQLHLALNSRVLIEQAKGVIAEGAGLDMDQAFARLRGYARRHQRLLGEVAQDVIDRRIAASSLVS
jgi:GAF domain-containing protein